MMINDSMSFKFLFYDLLKVTRDFRSFQKIIVVSITNIFAENRNDELCIEINYLLNNVGEINKMIKIL